MSGFEKPTSMTPNRIWEQFERTYLKSKLSEIESNMRHIGVGRKGDRALKGN
jgi:hypothetical protein